LSRKQSILRRWEAENGNSPKTEAPQSGSEAMEVENHPPLPLHPAFRERSKPNNSASKSINSDIFCTIEQVKFYLKSLLIFLDKKSSSSAAAATFWAARIFGSATGWTTGYETGEPERLGSKRGCSTQNTCFANTWRSAGGDELWKWCKSSKMLYFYTPTHEIITGSN